jgi:hypothetical protein
MAIVRVRKARYDRHGIEHCVDCVGYPVGGKGECYHQSHRLGGTMSCGAWRMAGRTSVDRFNSGRNHLAFAPEAAA